MNVKQSNSETHALWMQNEPWQQWKTFIIQKVEAQLITVQ